MDGNGRWATSRGLQRLQGHHAGVKAVTELVRVCPEMGVSTMTLFAFAIANWKRDQAEVDGLWVLFHSFILNDLQELVAQGVKISVVGNREGLPEHIQTAVGKVETDSEANTTFLLQIALNYDGVDEVARMVKNALIQNISPEEVTSEYVQTHLDTQPNNDPDIIIRTGMPKPMEHMALWRSSAFLPMQSVQSVCVSTEVLWPDFTEHHLKEIIEYADLDSRLFGGQRK